MFFLDNKLTVCVRVIVLQEAIVKHSLCRMTKAKKNKKETLLAIFTLLSGCLSNRVLTYSLEMHAEVRG